MKKLLFAALTASLLTIPQVAFAQSGDLDCKDFNSQAAAQAHLRNDPSDPDGLDARVGPADGNDQAGGDGIACESRPDPRDVTPVFENGAKKPPDSTLPRANPPTEGDGLPFTGSHTPMLLTVGLGLLTLGALLVRKTRTT